VVRFSKGLVMRFETGTTGRSLSPLWSMGSGIGEWTEYGYILGTKGQLLFDLMPCIENGIASSAKRELTHQLFGRNDRVITFDVLIESTFHDSYQLSPTNRSVNLGLETLIATMRSGLVSWSFYRLQNVARTTQRGAQFTFT